MLANPRAVSALALAVGFTGAGLFGLLESVGASSIHKSKVKDERMQTNYHGLSDEELEYRRRMQIISLDECGICKVFTVQPTDSMEIRSFSFEANYEGCMHAKVYHSDGPLDANKTITGFTPTTDGEVWTLICDSLMNATEVDRSAVPSQDCSTVQIEGGMPHTFHLVTECCDEGQVGVTSDYDWPVLSDYVYSGADCTPGPFDTNAPTAPPTKAPSKAPTAPPTKAPFSFEIASTNIAPNAVDDSATTPAGTPVDIPVLLNDDDGGDGPAGELIVTDPMTVPPSNGNVVVNDDGTIKYTPNPGFVGEDTFTYTVSDGEDTATAVVTVTVTNNAPVANDDARMTYPDTAVDVPVLSNDNDPEGQTLTVTSTSTPTSGTAVINGDGTNPLGTTPAITYTPNPGFVGVDTFTYTISDGAGGTDTATVTITVADNNVIAEDDSVAGQMNTDITGDVMPNDSDPEGDDMSVVDNTDGANGVATVNPDGTFTYTPNPGFHGMDTFTYILEDSKGAQDTATVTVDVNGPPDAVDDSYGPTVGLLTPVVGKLFDNDSDPDGDELRIVTNSISTPSCGQVNILNYGKGEFEFLPSGGATPCVDGDNPCFTYTVTDGRGGTDSAEVCVDAVNIPPKAEIDQLSIQGLTPVTASVLTNDKDDDGGVLKVLSLKPAGGDPCDITTAGTCTFTDACGTLVMNNAQGDFTYTPTSTGPECDPSFFYTMSDSQGGTSMAELRFDVNQAPDANDDSYTAKGGATGFTEMGNIMLNDSDEDAPRPANSTRTTAYDEYGDFVDIRVMEINGNTFSGTYEYNDTAANVMIRVNKNGDLEFDPMGQTSGTYSFTYTIIDLEGGTDQATVTINMEAGTDAPTAKPTLAPTDNPRPTYAPVAPDPTTARPTTNEPLTVTTSVKYGKGSIDPYLGSNEDVTPDLTFWRGDSATFSFKAQTCYVDPGDFSAETGMAFGHFDADYVDVNPGWPGNGYTNAHKHTYDDTCDCTWVDYFRSVAWDTTLDINSPNLASPWLPENFGKSVKFKIVIINDALNTAGILAINHRLDTVADADLKDTSKYYAVTDYAKIPVADLPIYTLDPNVANNDPDVTLLTELSMGYHKDAIQRGPHGIVPSSTGSMKSNLPGLWGEWRTGALTVQLILVNDDNTMDVELAPWLSNSTSDCSVYPCRPSDHGPVKPPDDPELYPQPNDAKVVFEGTLFWHGGDVGYICGDYDAITGDCYDTGTQQDFINWYGEMYGSNSAVTDADGDPCEQYYFCYAIVDGQNVGDSPSYTIDPITKHHTVEAVFRKATEDCPVFSTLAPTVSPAPSISMHPSAEPTTSRAPTASPAPTAAAASLTWGASETEKCFGWAYVANDCFYGKFGTSDGAGDSAGDGVYSKWQISGETLPTNARTCGAVSDTTDLANFPAAQSSGACPDKAETQDKNDKAKDDGTGDIAKVSTALGDSGGWVYGDGSSTMLGLDCVEISFDNKVTCGDEASRGETSAAITSKTYAEIDGNNRYKVTLKVADNCKSQCWLDTASIYYYDITNDNTDELDQTTKCLLPEDSDDVGKAFKELVEKKQTFSPLVREVSFYPLEEYELFSASATVWCGKETSETKYGTELSNNNGGLYYNNVDNGVHKTIIQDKEICTIEHTANADTGSDTEYNAPHDPAACVENIKVD